MPRVPPDYGGLPRRTAAEYFCAAHITAAVRRRLLRAAAAAGLAAMTAEAERWAGGDAAEKSRLLAERVREWGGVMGWIGWLGAGEA